VQQFRDAVGMPPKLFARIVRFDAALDMLRRRAGSWAAIANGCGYYDQAHFIREFHEFAGVTPTQFVAEERSPHPRLALVDAG
jgi:AraC-like DNA-binding protein